MQDFFKGAIDWIFSNKYEVLIGIILIPFLIWLLCYLLSALILYFNPLDLSPQSKKIVCENESVYQKEDYYVYLTNKGSQPLYDINVWVNFPKEVSVSIDPEKISENNMLGNGVVWDSSSFQLNGTSVDGKLGITQTVINNLGPQETIKIKVVVDKKKYRNNFYLKINAKANSRKPKPIISN